MDDMLDRLHELRGLPEWAKDAIHTDVEVVMDWRDRLRVLFGARVLVRVRTDCEHAPGRVESETRVNTFFPHKTKMELGVTVGEISPTPPTVE